MSDESDIQLGIALGDSAQRTEELVRGIARLIDVTRTIDATFKTLGAAEGGAEKAIASLGKLLGEVNILQRALKQDFTLKVPTDADRLTKGLTATARAARDAKAAITELDIAAQNTGRARQASIRSNDPARVAAAAEADRREAAQARLEIEALQRKQEGLDNVELRRNQREITSLQRQLETTLARLARAEARLGEMAQAAALDRRVAGLQAGAQARAAFRASTPEGQALDDPGALAQARRAGARRGGATTENLLAGDTFDLASAEVLRRRLRARVGSEADALYAQTPEGIKAEQDAAYKLKAKLDAAADRAKQKEIDRYFNATEDKAAEEAAQVRKATNYQLQGYEQDRAAFVKAAARRLAERNRRAALVEQAESEDYRREVARRERSQRDLEALTRGDANAINSQINRVTGSLPTQYALGAGRDALQARLGDAALASAQAEVNEIKRRISEQLRIQGAALRDTPEGIAAEAKAALVLRELRAKLKGAEQNAAEANKELFEQEAQNTAAQRRRAAEIRKRAREINGENEPVPAAKPTLQEAAASKREFHNEYLFGDGGANLFATQTRLLLNYKAMDAVFSTLSNGVESVLRFDKAMAEMQALLGANSADMEKFANTVLGVAKASKFSLQQITEATQAMASSGLSLLEITSYIGEANKLAAATGSTLHQTTELLISATDTFKLGSNEAGHVADAFTATLNSSRISLDRLNSAFQSVAVTAAESGLSFYETNAALKFLSDQGLNSGQQLQNGFRQVLTELAEPTEKFKQRLDELGVGVQEIDPRVNGLVGVFENLRVKGFSAADALEVFGSRGAAAFGAFLSGGKGLQQAYTDILNSQGASDAAAVAVDNLADKWTKFGNSVDVFLNQSARPIIDTLKVIVDGMTSVVGGVNGGSKAMGLLTTTVLSFTAVKLGLYIKDMAAGFVRTRAAAIEAAEGITLTGTAARTSAVAVTVLGGALKAALLPLGLTLALTAVVELISAMSSKTKDLSAESENLITRQSALKDAFEETGKNIHAVSDFLDATNARSTRLSTNQDELNSRVLEARTRFGDLGTALQGNIGTFDDLIDRVVKLRQELQNVSNADLEAYLDANQKKSANIEARIKAATGRESFKRVAEALGGNTAAYTNSLSRAHPEKVDAFLVNNLSESYNSEALRDALQYLSPLNKDTGDASQITEIISRLRADKDKFKPEEYDAVADALRTRLGLLVERKKNDHETLSINQQLSLGQFNTSRSGQEAQRLLLEMQRIVEENSKAIGNTGSVEAQSKNLSALKTRLLPMFDALKAIRDGLSKEDQANFDQSKEVGGVLTSVRAELNKTTNVAQNAFDRSVVTRTKTRAEALQREFTTLLYEYQHPELKRPHTAEELKTVARTLMDARRSDELSGLDLQRRARTNPLSTEAYRDAVTNANAKYDDELQKLYDQIDEQKLKKKREPRTTFGRQPSEARDLAAEIALIEDDARTRQSSALQPFKAREAYINAATTGADISKAQAALAKEELNGLKIAQSHLDLEIISKEAEALRGMMSQIDQEIAVRAKKLDDLAKKYGITRNADGQLVIGKSGGLSSQELADIGSQYQSDDKELHRLMRLKGDTGAKINDLDVRSEGYRGEIAAREPNGATLGSTFRDSVQEFRIKQGFDLKPYKELGDAFTQVFDKMNESFGNFIYNFATGATKGKNVAREFAASILASAAQMAANKAAAALLGLALDTIGGLFKVSTTGPGQGASNWGTNAGGGRGLYSGGIIGAYGGMVIPKFEYGGIIPGVHIGRDNTPILAAPGEAVLNRSAVSLIGTDMVNAMNRGAVRRGAMVPSMPLPAQHGDVNVYMVDERSKPVVSKADILATIHDDVLAGGTTKKLITSVSRGQI